MKSIFKLATVAAFCLASAGCNDYFHDINWPYGGLTEEDLDRDNLRQGSMLPTMEQLIVPMVNAGAFQHCESLVGDVWGRMLMSKPGGNGGAWSGDFRGIGPMATTGSAFPLPPRWRSTHPMWRHGSSPGTTAITASGL